MAVDPLPKILKLSERIKCASPQHDIRAWASKKKTGMVCKWSKGIPRICPGPKETSSSAIWEWRLVDERQGKVFWKQELQSGG